jgi:arabinose-5-phosphate isomerase
MMTDEEIAERGRRVLRMEQEAVARLERGIDAEFVAAVRLLASCTGRIIVAGVGKSGIVGRKIAATLTSTGSPATFLHPVESQHGDFGLVGSGDVALLVSKSGDSEELLTLLEQLKRVGVRTLALVGDSGSPLARHVDLHLDVSVAEEACPHNLAPTTSTTAALAMGDALAVALLELKGFRAEDFARLHPGGALGRKLLTTVADVMLEDKLPTLPSTATMREAVVQLAERRGIAMILDGGGTLAGVITAGDLTRAMEREEDILSVPVTSVMTRSPKTCSSVELGSAVVYRMEKHGIMAMPVVEGSGAVVGVVHLHDLMRAGAA